MGALRNMALVALASLLLAAPNPADAQGVEAFYKGRQVNLLIGFGPGGANDVWGRIIARHIGRHIPGNPAVVPQNATGAGTLKLALQLANASPADGTVFGLISRGIPLEPLLGDKTVPFNPPRMGWIGSPDQDTTVCVARKDAPATSMADLATTQLTMGGSGSGADTAVYPEFFAQFLGMKFKTVKGYPGSNDVFLALERKEVDGICVAYDSLVRQRLFIDGELTVLFQASLKADPTIGPVPIVSDSVSDPGKRELLDFFLMRAAVGRPFVAPPGLPPDRLKALQDAFLATLKDPVFIAESQKLGLSIDPVSGPELAELIARIYRTPEASVKAVADILKAIGN